MQKSCCNCRKLFNSNDPERVGDNCSPKCSDEFDEYMKNEMGEELEDTE